MFCKIKYRGFLKSVSRPLTLRDAAKGVTESPASNKRWKARWQKSCTSRYAHLLLASNLASGLTVLTVAGWKIPWGKCADCLKWSVLQNVVHNHVRGTQRCTVCSTEVAKTKRVKPLKTRDLHKWSLNPVCVKNKCHHCHVGTLGPWSAN